VTLDADRRRLERAALTDPGEAARALGRERLRALATVPLEAQTRALNALVRDRGQVSVPGIPTHVQVAMQASPDARGSLEIRLGDRVERCTFPPEAPT